MNPLELTNEQRLIITKVEKLLRLAGGTTHPEEAASAAKKAADLLLAYNLSEAALGHSEEGARGKEHMTGGFYEYERDLMRRIAEVNFCMYNWSVQWVRRPDNEMAHAKVQEIKDPWRRENIKRHRHRLVGRKVAILMCQQMYEYLIGAIERGTKEYVAIRADTTINAALRSRTAASFREGMAEEVGWRLWVRRQEQLKEEEAKMRAAAANGNGSGNTANAVTIASVQKSEYDANMDFQYGEGWSARNRAESAARQAARKAAEDEYARWAEAHPEEAAKKEAEAEAEAERERKKWEKRGKGSRGGTYEKPKDWNAHSAGTEAGRNVSLDAQIDKTRDVKKLG